MSFRTLLSRLIEIMYQPKTTFEGFLSKFIRSISPYFGALTYTYHVDFCRRSGISVDELYHQKFYRESPIHWHLYAQYFHPTTLHERIRDVSFYKRTAVLFKGFSVPDWATVKNRGSYREFDAHSKLAWHNAQHDLRAEMTPHIFPGIRMDALPLRWADFEGVGTGNSSRLFYNEVPKVTKYRFGGRFDASRKRLLSFKYANQDYDNLLGFDTSTEEGRAAFKAELKEWQAMTPEVFEDIDVDGDYEIGSFVSQEPHFQRTWMHYRQFQFKGRIAHLVGQGELSQDDVDRARPFFDQRGLPSASLWALGQTGNLNGIDAGSQESFQTVLKALGLDAITYDNLSSEPADSQFWNQYDDIFDLSEQELEEHLPLFLSESPETKYVGEETTKRLE